MSASWYNENVGCGGAAHSRAQLNMLAGAVECRQVRGAVGGTRTDVPCDDQGAGLGAFVFSRPGKEAKTMQATRAERLAARMQAILDNAQAEGRNITEAEEAEYLRLARLHAVAVELEGYDDDEEDA